MLAVYFLLVLLLCLTAGRAAIFARSLGISPLLTSGIVVAAIAYGSCLAAGALGVLYTATIYALCIVACLALLVLLAKLTPARSLQREAVASTPEASINGPPTAADWVTGTIGLVGAIPLLAYLRQLPSSLIHPNRPLGWDTVSYHLPGFIEFWQNHSLWSVEGPYQSYSFAFELIGNFLSHPFFSHWGLILANAFAVGLLVVATALIARDSTAIVRPSGQSSLAWLSTALIAIGFWASVHPAEIAHVGKNDIFMTAGLLASLAFILQISRGGRGDDLRDWSLVVLASISLGLSLGTKPSALAYVPFFALATAVVLGGGVTRGSGSVRRKMLRGMALVASISMLLGGFWLFRNLVIFGRLSPVKNVWQTSLVANISNPALYEINRGSILFLIGLLATAPGLLLILAQRRRTRGSVTPLHLLVGFHLVACAAFALTPHAVFRHDLDTSVWQLRLGMPLFVSAGLIYGLLAADLSARFSSWRFPSRVTLASLLLLALIMPWPIHWQANQSPALVGHDRIKGLPQTEVYAWIGRQESALRIYSAGLRPYGLYGPGWSNTLFYDLHSTAMSKLRSGVARIAAVTVWFRPDLIIISVDPHTYTGSPTKPITVQWLQQRPTLFDEVLSGETVSIFRVKPGAADQLRPLILDGYILKSGG